MDENTKLQIEEKIVMLLKTVYDPEIPVDIYSLGLIYGIDVEDDGNVNIDMTLTAPSCPASDFLMEDIRTKLESSLRKLRSVGSGYLFNGLHFVIPSFYWILPEQGGPC